jgi:L-asparaginase
MRIHVTYTGGTIGMTATEAGYVPAPGTIGPLLDALVKAADGQLPDIDFLELDPLIDSSNATPATWRRIAETLHHLRDSYDGFVVLHGTDTMAYTSSALSFLLPGFGKPVIVTGSQVPLEVVRSDGRQNLVAALQVAASGRTSEVCLLFGSKVLRGNRATKVDATGLDAFDSPSLHPLAMLGAAVDFADIAPPPADPASGTLRDCGLAHVAALRLFPGIDADVIGNLTQPPLQGLVIEAYGTGNGPAADAGFLGAIAEATARGIVVIVVTQCLRGAVIPGAYATGSALLEAGAIPGYDLTTEAALTKLSVLLGARLPAEKVRELMTTNLAGELTLPRD